LVEGPIRVGFGAIGVRGPLNPLIRTIWRWGFKPKGTPFFGAYQLFEKESYQQIS
jgi:hypothetical protein